MAVLLPEGSDRGGVRGISSLTGKLPSGEGPALLPGHHGGCSAMPVLMRVHAGKVLNVISSRHHSSFHAAPSVWSSLPREI